MIRLVLPALLTLAVAARGATAERGQLDASPTLFTVTAALNATGYDTDLGSPNNHPLREAIRKELASRKIPSLTPLKEFFDTHRKDDPTANLSQYISWALSVGDPPEFKLKTRDVDVPPDAAALDGLGILLADFYKEANIADLWQRSQAAIENYLDWYHEPVVQAVQQVNGYLRHIVSGRDPGRFQIYVDLLGAPNQVQTRSYRNDYYVVVTPSPQPQVQEIRHAYLHYLIEPMATRNQEVIMRKRGLADHAQRAEALDPRFKNDFLLLTSESLIKAIEARLDRKPVEVTQALKQGYILTPYFAEQLPAYEKEGASMALYFPDLVKDIELKKEDARLSQVEFDKQAPVRMVPVAPRPAPVVTGAAKTLQDAEQYYKARDLNNAKAAFAKVLEQTDDQPLHAKAYYGLARVAVLERDPETAQRLFQKTLESQPDPQDRAWTLVYLGRLSDAEGERDQAIRHYQDALKVEGASQMARQAAEQGIQASYKK